MFRSSDRRISTGLCAHVILTIVFDELSNRGLLQRWTINIDLDVNLLKAKYQ